MSKRKMRKLKKLYKQVFREEIKDMKRQPFLVRLRIAWEIIRG